MADPAEIEVVGAYDQDRADPGVRRPIPDWDVAAVKGLASREQVRRSLQALTDESLIRISRHIQYRHLSDGSLWDVSGHTSVSRVVESAEAVQPASVRALPEVDAESAADYARGSRPMPPPKETDNPCQTCAGHGVCPSCMGSGQA